MLPDKSNTRGEPKSSQRFCSLYLQEKRLQTASVSLVGSAEIKEGKRENPTEGNGKHLYY